MTQVYFLFPIYDNDPVWPVRQYRGSCLVYAGNEAELEELAMKATKFMAWQDPDKVSCRGARLYGDPPPEGYRAVFYDDPRGRTE